MTSAFELKDLTLARGSKTLVAQASAKADPGTLIVLLGPNGSGKSTLLAACAGILPAINGQILCFARDLAGIPRRELARSLSFLPQRIEYEFGPTVLDVVLLGLFAQSSGLMLPLPEDINRARAALARCSAEALQARPFHLLSGGERQRVLLAQLLVQDSKVWLLDEPTSGLDVAHAQAAMSMLRDECKLGRTILIAMHDFSLARHYADELWVLADQDIVIGKPDEVLTSKTFQTTFGVATRLGDIDGYRYVVSLPIAGHVT